MMFGNRNDSSAGINIGVVGGADIYGGGAPGIGNGVSTKTAAGWTYIWAGVAVFILFFSTYTVVRHLEG
jgi:hypothetical protein